MCMISGSEWERVREVLSCAQAVGRLVGVLYGHKGHSAAEVRVVGVRSYHK